MGDGHKAKRERKERGNFSLFLLPSLFLFQSVHRKEHSLPPHAVERDTPRDLHGDVFVLFLSGTKTKSLSAAGWRHLGGVT
mmetsp:Transcript_54339/g.106331  ORF Transcript_54339/g.106331 Transcript_54339/m.106331 type:complete len:81 (-) Transcript_54339:942-1184(-)